MMEGNVYQRKRVTKTLAVVGLAALAALAGWQFYLFAGFKDSQGVVDVQGGTVHLWLAIGITLIVCIAGFFLFSQFLRYDKGTEMHITSPGQARGDGRIRRDVL
jgi:glycerol-3-phosphate acyltransferase PlsY